MRQHRWPFQHDSILGAAFGPPLRFLQPSTSVSGKYIIALASFCRETLEMGVFQGVRAYAEALEWLSWLRSGTDQEGKKCRNRHKRRAANTRHQRHVGWQ